MFKTIIRPIFEFNCKKKLNIFMSTKTYEGDGKTKVNILNEDADSNLMVNGYSQVGFRLNNGITILGPMAIFPRSVLSWNVANIDDVREESLSLFKVLEPKLDILIIGTGDKRENSNTFVQLLSFLKKNKLNFELLPTDQACATFNFLNSEGRYVAAAMIPPQTISTTDDDLLRSKLKYQNLYKVEY